MYQILKKQTLNANTKLMVIEAPHVARKAEPGQFIILRVSAEGERIPLTIADFDREKGSVTIIFQEVGATTMALGALNEGDCLHDFVGPLGKASELEGLKKVAVVGGGNVAMDAARCSKRLGAEVYVVYRRGMEELPARHEEVEHAEEEGIIFKTLTNPVKINGNENGYVASMTCVEMELGEPDASGRRRPIEKVGSDFDLPVDCVIMSLGTTPNPLIKNTTPGLEVNRKGGIVVNEEGLTSHASVYAGGDAVTGAATVILAMGAGKLGAKSIDEQLSKK
mgnify:CR=1 FL=1